MCFYLKPPNHSSKLHLLQNDTEIRLRFLILLQKCNGDEFVLRESMISEFPFSLDALVEGSHRDRASHYMLRIASLRSYEMQEFFYNAETKLFCFRLKSNQAIGLNQAVSQLNSHCCTALKIQELSKSYRTFLSQVQKATIDIFRISMNNCLHRENCTHFIKVPWSIVPNLVKSRDVEIALGLATVPCSKLSSFLISVFKEILNYGMKQHTEFPPQNLDERIESMVNGILNCFHKWRSKSILKNKLTLTANNIENYKTLMPLCMQQIHSTLSKTNRVRHNSRFSYTLFLKDAGLSMEENILFWEKIYSQPIAGHSCCQHSWTGSDASRYKYSIRHMYGLEGRKINYSSHSCSALQESHAQPTECKGCPFVKPNEDVLLKLLDSMNILSNQDKSEIVHLSNSGQPSLACKSLLNILVRSHKERILPPKKRLCSHILPWESDDDDYTANISNICFPATNNLDVNMQQRKNLQLKTRKCTITMQENNNTELIFSKPYQYFVQALNSISLH